MLAVAIGILCVTLVGLGQVLRMPVSRITLLIEASSATFALANDWVWDASISGAERLRLVGFDDVKLPSAIAGTFQATSTDAYDFAGGRLALDSFSAGTGGGVTIESADGTTDVFARRAPVKGQLTLMRKVEVSAGSNAVGGTWTTVTSDAILPEIVTFSARSNAAVPVHVQIEGGGAVSMDNIGITALSFARERASGPGAIEFESTIMSGEITFPETRKEIILGRGDHLEIGDATEARVINLSIEGGITVAFEGKASVISLVQAGKRSDLRPTILEYLYHNQFLAFLWSALGIVWGLAWSVRRTIY